MNPKINDSHPDRWPLARVLFGLLGMAFFGLMVDIRIEHVEAVRERYIAWLPIIYSGFMGATCGVASVFWSKIARRIMLPLFLLAFIVGGLGFYIHNDGHFGKVIVTMVKAWTDPQMNHSHAPPPAAALAFAGLGAIGVLACLNRFNSGAEITSNTPPAGC